MFKEGDLCTVKGDDRHLWRITWIDGSSASHFAIPIWEAGLELIGEAWVRTKVVPLVDLQAAQTKASPQAGNWRRARKR